MNNPPVFPMEKHLRTDLTIAEQRGMKLRDYFAAKAMPIAMETLRQDWTKDDGDEWYWNPSERELIAEHAYQLADAMLKAREKHEL